jgi:nucleotide-binding universal stress UspA family protein
MKKILVGYTGTVHGDKTILEIAKKHALAFEAALIIVTSIESVEEQSMDEMKGLEKHLEYVRENMKKAGVTCATRILVRTLNPGEDIVAFAKEEKVDEIMIGIEKKSKVGKLLFGSNAQYVVLEAPCPVVCVRA